MAGKSNDISPQKIRKFGSVGLILVAAVIGGLIWTSSPHNPEVNVNNFRTYGNTYGVSFTLKDVPPNSSDLWLMQYTGERFVVYDTLPYRAVTDEPSYITSDFINVDGGSLLTFVFTDDALSRQIMAHSDVGAADGFKSLTAEELRGAYFTHTSWLMPDNSG